MCGLTPRPPRKSKLQLFQPSNPRASKFSFLTIFYSPIGQLLTKISKLRGLKSQYNLSPKNSMSRTKKIISNRILLKARRADRNFNNRLTKVYKTPQTLQKLLSKSKKNWNLKTWICTKKFRTWKTRFPSKNLRTILKFKEFLAKTCPNKTKFLKTFKSIWNSPLYKCNWTKNYMNKKWRVWGLI